MECEVDGCIKPVFGRGMCHAHYDADRRSRMPACETDGCDDPQVSKGLCSRHYRQWRRTQNPECSVEGCRSPQVARKLCDAHHHRLTYHGSTAPTRPADWGAKTKHPLYHSWDYQRRNGGRVEEWNDFWAFVRDVGGEKLDHRATRLDRSEKWGPSNFKWEAFKNRSSDRATYQRQWRSDNRRTSWSNDLKNKYGITADDYDRMLEEQNGVCALCERPETVVDKRSQTPRRLAVDHCHDSGKVRGLLCTFCNTMLGGSRDDIDLLKKAIAYLG